MLEILALGIDVVQDLICIKLVARRENCHFVVLVDFFQHFMGVRPDVEVCLKLFTRLQVDL